MTEEILEPKEVTERWNLSDDDDYVDINIIEDEEPENHLKEQVDELLKKIKSLLKGDSFSLELKEVPRYISAKQIEQFFEIEDPSHAEVEDPDPKNKRDVIVTFFNADDFCNALRKNGKLIGSYTYVANYNPTIHRKLKTKTSFKRKDSERYEKKHNFHERSGDVRKQDKAREFKHDRHDMGKPGKREFNRKDHRDFGGRPNRGAYSPMDRRGPATHRKQETTVMESTNRFSMFGDEDEESCVCL